jgi:hypothetical protein
LGWRKQRSRLGCRACGDVVTKWIAERCKCCVVANIPSRGLWSLLASWINVSSLWSVRDAVQALGSSLVAVRISNAVSRMLIQGIGCSPVLRS